MRYIWLVIIAAVLSLPAFGAEEFRGSLKKGYPAKFSSMSTATLSVQQITSTAADGSHMADIGNGVAYTGPRTKGVIFHNISTINYCETDNNCKRVGSQTPSAGGITGAVSSSVDGSGVLTIVTSGGTATYTPATWTPAGGGGGSYSDILFWWRAESATLATGDYPASGSLTANNASATITSGATNVGSYGVSSVAPYAYYYKAVTAGDLINPTVGRVGFWFKYNSTYQARTLFRYYVDTTHYMYITGVAGGDIGFTYKDNTTTKSASSTLATKLVADTWYFAEASWDVNGNALHVYINGAQVATQDLTGITTLGTTGQIQIGESAGSSAPNEFVDNIMISNSTTRDFYGGGAGLCASASSPR
ncbi:LamG domain-containing protein [Geomonas nitrogeniifigens]|uniref:LamG domain-containing protein n=1 Tax=Geomonas diazotrophica TaxID=2843197 RepID=UPI001C2C18E0|nr:LamG domain-containing protein [Geomonas nitrogeniifigens]QXE85957.1 LamG domain-containing protein [Geomonas nitrogeniifigens]